MKKRTYQHTYLPRFSDYFAASEESGDGCMASLFFRYFQEKYKDKTSFQDFKKWADKKHFPIPEEAHSHHKDFCIETKYSWVILRDRGTDQEMVLAPPQARWFLRHLKQLFNKK